MRSEILSCLNMLVSFSQRRRHLRTQSVRPPAFSSEACPRFLWQDSFPNARGGFRREAAEQLRRALGCCCLRNDRTLHPGLRTTLLETCMRTPRAAPPHTLPSLFSPPRPGPSPGMPSPLNPCLLSPVASSQPHLFGWK